ncbi:MAG: transcriptional regulator [SAR86 cluster bacterium]|uniref:Transcriptional regulator n=1 Tax=SAR86 cluster bacterium TaxID=2030880 RepID=A0A2A4WYC4_9GAMM|nr:MAG: transcriptional regulator [SAR86 cluster bacterium]
MVKSLSIGGLSDKTGVNIETIRYYEREDILPKPSRSDGGRRIYGNEDVRRLNFIHKCRQLGFSLKEVISLMSLVDTGDYTCKQVHDLTLVHASEVSEKIENLKRMERVLLEMADKCGKGSIPECPIIDSLFLE